MGINDLKDKTNNRSKKMSAKKHPIKANNIYY